MPPITSRRMSNMLAGSMALRYPVGRAGTRLRSL
jgi:hypothetical protein